MGRTRRSSRNALGRLAGLVGLSAASLLLSLPAGAQTPWAWGDNQFGQLGDGTNIGSRVPVRVSTRTGLSGVTGLAGGGEHSLALAEGGTVWAWGNNDHGQLGNGTTTPSNVPVPVPAFAHVTALAAGDAHSLALKDDGTVWAWGGNWDGQLGDGTATDSHHPVQVLTSSGPLAGVVAIAAGGGRSLALGKDGSVWVWGGPPLGLLESGTPGDRSRVAARVATPTGDLEGVTAIAAGEEHCLALRGDGTVWAWGSNWEGQLGDGTTTFSAVPVRVSVPSGVIGLAAGSDHSVALGNDGTLWAWGANGSGQLFAGAVAYSSVPLRVSGLMGVTAVSGGGDRSMALMDDGTARTSRDGAEGSPGDGADGLGDLPVQVPGLVGVAALASGGNHALALAEGCPAITLSPPSLPIGTLATPYSQTLSASGGMAPYTYAVTAGGLPAGLGLNGSTGLLSGTPTATGSFPFTLTATDSSGGAGTLGCTGSQAYTMTIGCATISLSPSSLPNGALATAYSQTITASGGTAPYTFAVTAGSLAPGLGLNATTGVLSGTPAATGSFPFTLTATDARGCTGSQAYTVVVACPVIVLSPSSLPNGTLLAAYSQTISASGGTAPYTFAVTAGSLPAGFSLNGTTGVLSGTPAATGSFSFTLAATDASGCSTSQAYTLVLTCPAIVLSPPSLPNGSVSAAYSQAISAGGGTAPYTFAITAGSLPSGLSLSSTSGLLAGTPTAAGSFSFTVTATDAHGCSGTKAYTLVVLNCTLPPAWTPTASMSTPRQGHAATLLNSGKVLVAGGNGSSNPSSALASCELYTPTPGTWSPSGAMVTARGSQKATLLNNGKVLVAGGLDATGSPLASAEIYDPVAGTWSATGPMAVARYNHTMTLLPSGKVLVAGGTTGSSPLATAQVYDPAAGTWSTTGSMATGRYNHTATLLPSGKVLVAGGASSTSLALSSVQVYDPAAGTWSATSSMTSARSGHTATLLQSGKVLVAGGLGTSGLVSIAEIYDPAAGTWSPTGAMAAARFYHSETLLLSGKVLVAGGSGNSGFLSSSEVYDPAAGTWSAGGSMATTREFHTATRIPSGKVLVTGGWKGSLGLAGAELFDPAPCCPTTITLSPASLPVSTVAASYSQRITASGEAEPYTFEILEGTLPPGLTLEGDTGVLSGTPAGTGTFNFTVVARPVASVGCAGSQHYSLSVVNPVVISSIKKAVPFRFNVRGSNLQSGVQVTIGEDATPWPSVTWKNATKLVIGGGKALKARVPKGVPTTFTFVNPDGGVVVVADWHW